MIEIDRLELGFGRFGDQLVGRLVTEREMLLDDTVQLVALAWRDLAIDRGGVHQQCGGRQAIIVVGKLARMFFAVDKFGNEGLQRFKHNTVAFLHVSRLRIAY